MSEETDKRSPETPIQVSTNPHGIKKEIFDIPIEYNGTKVIYKMRQLNSDDIWSITEQTQKISMTPDGEPDLKVDQAMRNKISLMRSIVEPSMTIETISALPYHVANILLDCFNKLNMPDPELLKKTEIHLTF